MDNKEKKPLTFHYMDRNGKKIDPPSEDDFDEGTGTLVAVDIGSVDVSEALSVEDGIATINFTKVRLGHRDGCQG